MSEELLIQLFEKGSSVRESAEEKQARSQRVYDIELDFYDRVMRNRNEVNFNF